MSTTEKTQKPTEVEHADPIDPEKVSISQVSSVSSEKEIRREPPDGGWVAWFVVVGSFCSFFGTQGYGYSWGVFFDEYNAHVYPGQQTNLTWIGGLWYFMCNITGPFYVYLVSRFGDRKMVMAALIICPLGVMLASITNEVWQLYITQGIISGIGTSLAWFPGMTGPMEWFSKRRGLAVGITMSASGIGGLAISTISRAAIDSLGWQWALRILGFMQFGLLIVTAISTRPLNKPPHYKTVPIVDVSDFKNKHFIMLVAIHFIGNFAFYIPSSYVPTYARSIGLNEWTGATLSSIMSVCMFIGKISLGFCSDYIGRFNMAVICGTMACIAHLAVWLTATSDGSMWAFAVLYGLFGGGYIAMITAIIGQVAGVDHINSGTGWCYSAWSFGGLFGQPIASLISNRTSPPDYQGAIIFAGCLFFVGACMVFALRVMRGGWKILQVV